MKISNVKRSQHVKNKKSYTKPLKKKEQPNAKTAKDKKSSGQKTGGSIATNKVFGKPTAEKAKRRDKRNQVGKLLPLPPAPTTQHKQHHNGDKPGDEDEEEDEEEYTAQDMLDMMDVEERDAYVASGSGVGSKAKKRKRTDEEADDENRAAQHFEKQYAAQTNTESRGKKRIVDLLPIKTKGGDVVTRQTEVEDDEEECPEPEDDLEPDADAEDDEAADSDDDIIRDDAVRNRILLHSIFEMKFNCFLFAISVVCCSS